MTIVDHLQRHFQKEYREMTNLSNKRNSKAKRLRELYAEAKKLNTEITELDKEIKKIGEALSVQMTQLRQLPRQMRK